MLATLFATTMLGTHIGSPPSLEVSGFFKWPSPLSGLGFHLVSRSIIYHKTRKAIDFAQNFQNYFLP